MRARRTILVALGWYWFIAPRIALSQASRTYRIGWISLGRPDAPSPFLEAFRQGLRERGYIEGKNLVLEARLADGSRERADQMVQALVQSRVDVIVAQGTAVRRR